MGTLGMRLGILLLAILSTTVTAAESIDKQLLWGAYRPNLYFGVRPRITKSLSFGLMWAAVENGQLNADKLRHTCEQSDRMTEYGWKTYDIRTGGVQTISDPGNAVNLTVEFTKFPGLKGDWGDWSASIKGRPTIEARKDWNISVIFYLSIEDKDAPTPPDEAHGIQCMNWHGTVKCDGSTLGIGPYNILLPKPESKRPVETLVKTVLKSLTVKPSSRIWNVKRELLPSVSNEHILYEVRDMSFSGAFTSSTNTDVF